MAADSVLRGVGALGDMGRAALKSGGVNTQTIRQTVGDIKPDVRAAYNAVRGPGNSLERPR